MKKLWLFATALTLTGNAYATCDVPSNMQEGEYVSASVYTIYDHRGKIVDETAWSNCVPASAEEAWAAKYGAMNALFKDKSTEALNAAAIRGLGILIDDDQKSDQ